MFGNGSSETMKDNRTMARTHLPYYVAPSLTVLNCMDAGRETFTFHEQFLNGTSRLKKNTRAY